MNVKAKTGDRIPTLSGKEALVLELLLVAPSSEKYGLELVAESSNALKRGTVYVTLSRMEEKGYIESRLEPRRADASGLQRRLYRVTGYGQRVFEILQLAKNLGQLRTSEAEGAL